MGTSRGCLRKSPRGGTELLVRSQSEQNFACLKRLHGLEVIAVVVVAALLHLRDQLS